MASQRLRVLAGYRYLLRTTRIVFKKDMSAIVKARAAIREHFEQNRAVKDAASVGAPHFALDATLVPISTALGARSQRK